MSSLNHRQLPSVEVPAAESNIRAGRTPRLTGPPMGFRGELLRLTYGGQDYAALYGSRAGGACPRCPYRPPQPTEQGTRRGTPVTPAVPRRVPRRSIDDRPLRRQRRGGEAFGEPAGHLGDRQVTGEGVEAAGGGAPEASPAPMRPDAVAPGPQGAGRQTAAETGWLANPNVSATVEANLPHASPGAVTQSSFTCSVAASGADCKSVAKATEVRILYPPQAVRTAPRAAETRSGAVLVVIGSPHARSSTAWPSTIWRSCSRSLPPSRTV